jgi:hypothetical protein
MHRRRLARPLCCLRRDAAWSDVLLDFTARALRFGRRLRPALNDKHDDPARIRLGRPAMRCARAGHPRCRIRKHSHSPGHTNIDDAGNHSLRAIRWAPRENRRWGVFCSVVENSVRQDLMVESDDLKLGAKLDLKIVTLTFFRKFVSLVDPKYKHSLAMRIRIKRNKWIYRGTKRRESEHVPSFLTKETNLRKRGSSYERNELRKAWVNVGLCVGIARTCWRA